MSVENIEKFYALAYQDPSMIEALKTITDEETYLKTAVALGAEHDCSFTIEEGRVWLKEMAARTANGELDDLQLEAVAGGKGGDIAAAVIGGLAVVGGCALAATGIGAPAGAALIGGGLGIAGAGVGVVGASVKDM